MDSQLPSFGDLLRSFRNSEGVSQMELGGRAAVSTRHVSFLETGRASPSAEMVGRLGAALDLSPGEIDKLLDAAGFSRRAARPAERPEQRLLRIALRVDQARSASAVIAAGREVLPEFGVEHFFLGTLHEGSLPRFDFTEVGAFPASWARIYDRERYAATDPLLAVVRRGHDEFFWDDVIEPRALTRPARAMFDRVAGFGITSGFIAARRQPRSTLVLSMMGPQFDRRGSATRLALKIIGSRMLARISHLEMGRPGLAGSILPVR